MSSGETVQALQGNGILFGKREKMNYGYGFNNIGILMILKRVIIVSVLLAITTIAVSCINSICRPAKSGLYAVTDNQQIEGESRKGLVVVVHGWIEKGEGEWPEGMAKEIEARIDSNEWICTYFDWQGGASTLFPEDAAKFARDKGAKELAKIILERYADVEHIHFIAHSSGCWLINEAARITSESSNARIHLTFLDAYVPGGWDADLLAGFTAKKPEKYWAEHYFTRDYTGGCTQVTLKNAHNIDISNVDIGIKDHNFPWRWYYATIARKYPWSIFNDGSEYRCFADGVECGFIRSVEASGEKIWLENASLTAGNETSEAQIAK